MGPSSSNNPPVDPSIARERSAGHRTAVTSSAVTFAALIDRVALAGLVLGLILYVVPFWREGRLRWAFWVTLSSVLLDVWATHRRVKKTTTPGSPT